MPKPEIRIHDTATGEVIDRPMTNEEFAAYEINVAAAEAMKAEAEAKVKVKADLLARLGITAEEAASLLA
jgi:hypothetical protein